MLRGLWFAALLAFATSAIASLGPVSELVLANKNVAPDGFTRAASLINGMNPGPVIAVNKGDKLKLNLVNQLSDPNQFRGASIHWHGILQRGTGFMDGAAGVTQCPIAPNDSFQYAFAANVPGTYWYHSHFAVQYCDGIRGVIIVYDPNDPLKVLYDVDNEQTIITLSEWYHTLAASIHGIPLADATLINGKGRYPGGPKVDLAIVNVQKGKRYRFRLVSISCDPNFIFSIDNHDLSVIEVDGVPVKPHTVNTIQILSGQRYSVVLNANQFAGNYWIRALPNSGSRNLSSTFANGVNSAILRYAGAPILTPTTTQQATPKNLVEGDLHPTTDSTAIGKPTPDGADYVFNVTLGFDEEAFLFNVNGHVFAPPTVPVLLQIMSGARTAQELLPEGSVFVVERNKTVQVNFPSGLIGGPHPFHLHGHTFTVIKTADSGKFNFLNPVERDTVNIGNTEGDFVSVRFRTDNPGPWIFHCHIDFHLHEGLAFVFAEAPADIPKELSPPPAWDRLCPTWDALPESVKSANSLPTAAV